MKRLLLRELRRQSIPALGLLLLSWLLLPVMGLGVSLGVLRQVDPAISLLLLTCVTPWLLGVGAFAPDLEQGGEGFLARLPVSRLKVFALRLSVVFGLSALTVRAGLFGFELIDPALAAASVHGLYPKPMNALLLFLIPLAGGVLSGLALRRGLLAFALTPVLVGAPLALLRASESYWGAPDSVARVGLFALVAASLLCAAWIQRAELARAEVRGPLRRVALVFGPLVALYALGVGATRELDFALAAESDHPTHYLPAYRGARPRRLAIVHRYAQTELRWGEGAGRSGRVRQYLLDARTSTRWLLPLEETGVSVSPDERWLLTYDPALQRFTRWDIAEREALERWDGPAGVNAGELLWAQGQRVLGFQRALWTWVGEVPHCVRPGGLFARGVGEARVEGHILDARGAQVLVLREGSVERLEVGAGEGETLSTAGVRWEDARLSPSGEWAFVVGLEGEQPALGLWQRGQALRRLENVPPEFVRAWRDPGAQKLLRTSFDPAGKWVSVSLQWSLGPEPGWRYELRVISLVEPGRVHRLWGPSPRWPDWGDWGGFLSWSPDGRSLVGPHATLDLREGSVRDAHYSYSTPLLWLDDHRLFFGRDGVVDLETSTQGPPPAWLR